MIINLIINYAELVIAKGTNTASLEFHCKYYSIEKYLEKCTKNVAKLFENSVSYYWTFLECYQNSMLG